MNRNAFPEIGVIGVLCLSACGGGGGGDSGSPAPTVTIAVSPATIPAGQSAMLTWSSTNASSCSASGAWSSSQSTSGSAPLAPPGPATYTYTLSCSSSAGATATGSATLTVTPAQLAILTSALSNGVIGTLFDQTIQASGGVAPFAWKVSSGELPHNLSLSPSTANTVTISGTPDTVAQGVAFTIEVTDSAHNSASQPYNVSILLQADSLVLSPAAGLDFGNQIVGSASGALTETLTNTATVDIVINSIAIAPAGAGANAGEFTQTGSTCGASLAAGARCSVSVSFTPGQTGPRTAVLTITDDTAGSPQSVGLNGVGLSSGPNATLSVAGVTFGTQLVGTKSPAMSVALTNYGSVTLNIGSIAASTSFFAETNNCLPSLASQATCVISVTFTPGGSGNVTDTLSITDDAAGSPQKVSLRGTGSTMTPLLTGYCYSICKPQAKVGQCPAGLPAETPGDSHCPVGVLGGNHTPVDFDRPCTVPPGGFQDRGYCVTE
jgi:hypothetical protein